MVMYFVHIGRNKNITNCIVCPLWQADVSMCKCGDQYKDGLKNHNGIHGCAGHSNTHKKENTSEQTFARVVAQAGANIYFIICMMNNMEAP